MNRFTDEEALYLNVMAEGYIKYFANIPELKGTVVDIQTSALTKLVTMLKEQYDLSSR